MANDALAYALDPRLRPPVPDPTQPQFGAGLPGQQPLVDQLQGSAADIAGRNMYGDVRTPPPAPFEGMSTYVPDFGGKVRGWGIDAMRALGASPGYAENFGGGMQNIVDQSRLSSAYNMGRAGAAGDYGEAALNAANLYGGPVAHGALAAGGAMLHAMPGLIGRAGEEGAIDAGSHMLTPVKGDPTAPFNHDVANFPEGRISTTLPSAAGMPDPHLNNSQRIGADTLLNSPIALQRNVELLKQYPGINIPAGATPEEAHEAFVEHVKNNILALHDAVDPSIRAGSAKWYDGANTVANRWAQEYGLQPQQVAGALAALSPQKDWDANVSLSRRVLDTLHHEGDSMASPEMLEKMQGYVDAQKKPQVKAEYQRIKDEMTGQTLGSLDDPMAKAMFIRAFDEAHGPHALLHDEAGNPLPRAFRILSPTGEYGPIKLDKIKGVIQPASADWGSIPEIANAVRSATAPDMQTISRAMGKGHKVRNFYNNIIAPNSNMGDVTIDTHAVAAGLLRPLGSTTDEVDHGIGTGGSEASATGSKGLYGAYAEAYRRAAEAREMLPRQMQSITWEALRGRWNPVEKRSKPIKNAVTGIWNDYGAGKISQQQAQRQLLFSPEGESLIRNPRWVDPTQAIGEGEE